MSRVLAFVLFLGAAISVLGGIHYYLWVRLVRATALPVPWRQAATLTLVLLALSIPSALVLGRFVPAAWGHVLAYAAFIWLGWMFLLLVTFGGVDLAKLAHTALGALTGRSPQPDLTRRLFVTRLLAGGALLTTFGLGGVAMASALRPPAVRRLRIALSRLPLAMDGVTLVQLSDLHLGPMLGAAFFEDIIARTNALAADLVVITGDLVDGGVHELGAIVAALAKINARYGVYFVTGNHEYYAGVQPWLATLDRLGIRVLRNERVSIGTAEASFDLAGVDDPAGKQFGNGHGPNYERALAGRDPSRELVLLAHRPRQIKDAAPYDVGLQLSGHTHGGQIFPFSLLVHLTEPFVSGLHRWGNTQVYVSNGTGYWGPPMRLGAPAEITHFTLLAQPASPG